MRTALSFVAEVGREIGQSTRARLEKRRPRVSRAGLYPFVRAFATVVERDVVVAAVMGDMLAGRTAVYADLVAYDEVAHHSGPLSRDAEKVLARLDRSLALIEKVAEHAPRPYRVVVLSDHGQSPGETFRSRYGLTLGDLVRAGCGLPVPRRAERTRSGTEARAAVRAALRRWPIREREERHRPSRHSEPVVLASGNLGLVSFPDVPHRMSKEEIDARHPALLTTLAHHPGIGFLLVRSEEHGGLVLGAHGAQVPVDELEDGQGPLASFGPGAADAVRRTHSFPHAADIMINSFHDPADGEVLAFEEQIGSHGGLGGAQARPSCSPRWPCPRRWPTGRTWPGPSRSTACCAAGCASRTGRRCRWRRPGRWRRSGRNTRPDPGRARTSRSEGNSAASPGARAHTGPARTSSNARGIPRAGRHFPPEEVARCTFGVVLDTSASMDRVLLDKALGAIASYAAARDVPAARVVFCDAAPHDAGYLPVTEIAGRVRVHGRGGTVLQPGIDLLQRADDFPPGAPVLVITDSWCDTLRVRREHAYLVPQGRLLPFTPRGPVFRVR